MNVITSGFELRTNDPDAARCRALSRQVESLCLALLIGAPAVVGLSVTVPSSAVLLIALACLWAVQFATLARNRLLVRCGHQAIRQSLAPALVNRPEFLVRLGFHLLINWAVIATTLVAAWSSEGPFRQSLAWLASIAAIAVWVSFNLLHRRMNQARNLALTTPIAALLVAGGVYLIRVG